MGLVTGTCFSDMGNDVWCVDVDKKKIENLKNGTIPIYEPGLETLVLKNLKLGHLIFTTDIKEAVENTDICFIAVGTPMGEDGSADLQYVEHAAAQIGSHMTHTMFVVNKSTVPVGTARIVRRVIQQKLDERGSGLKFSVISNPEFLKEGTAVSDCLKPDRIVVGVENKDSEDVMKELYKPYLMSTENLIIMDIASAEMTKYAANAMLATKISYMNEISNICEKVGANVNKVRIGIGADHRIGYQFIYPGCGYGGSCFPKDVQALIRTSRKYGYEPELLQSVESVNYRQKQVIPEKVKEKFGKDLTGRRFAVWGLAFKPDTDDMREAAAVTIINELTHAGAQIQAYDPEAVEQAKKCYLKDNTAVTYMDSKYDALNEADALLLVTEWKEFRSPDFLEMKKRLNGAAIFDGRNQYDKQIMDKYGFEYYQIGVGEA